MKSSFTPGPWVWNKNDQLVSLSKKSGLGWPERIVETDSGYYPPFGADRSLISAAPELLEALQAALPHLEAVALKDNATYALARAAIAKATGEQA